MDKLIMSSDDYLDDDYLDNDYDFDFNPMRDDFNDIFNQIFPKGEVKLIAKNHGWLQRDGFVALQHYDQGWSAMSKIGADAFEVWERRDPYYGHHLAITSTHHDVPVLGREWTYFTRRDV